MKYGRLPFPPHPQHGMVLTAPPNLTPPPPPQCLPRWVASIYKVPTAASQHIFSLSQPHPWPRKKSPNPNSPRAAVEVQLPPLPLQRCQLQTPPSALPAPMIISSSPPTRSTPPTSSPSSAESSGPWDGSPAPVEARAFVTSTFNSRAASWDECSLFPAISSTSLPRACRKS